MRYINKGQNNFTEMYSALKAEVEYPKDKSTAFNDELLYSLKLADKLVVCGQALSHCVNQTVRDIISRWNPDNFGNIYLLEDGKETRYLQNIEMPYSIDKTFRICGD